LPVYQKHLASFSRLDNLVVVRPNDEEQLRQIFAEAEREGIFFEAFYMEPVMGEGDPGMATSPHFYREARRLTQEMGSMLVVDSIQAGLRAHGCLSIVDYPGMEGMTPPDMEVFSKALNAGQFPLSVLAVTGKTAALYVEGIYGNTMTSNPRALDVATAVLSQVKPALSRNISEMGKALLEEFKKLKSEFPHLIDAVKGTGLLLSIQINKEYGSVSAAGGMEYQLRQAGFGVIHGGKNSLRFTPHFNINAAEISLMVTKLRELFKKI
jgi:acetylornithine/succinyldiaminopimelate/putrescine aminotransferase